MKIIKNRATIHQYIETYHIKDYFEEIPDDFYIMEYEKNECIINPLSQTDIFYFIVQGTIHIYSIHYDGSMFTLTINDKLTLLGDVEFVNHISSNYFVEAKSQVIALCLKMNEKYKDDHYFLQYLLKSLSYKLIQSSQLQANYVNLEDKLIAYIKYDCQNQTLTQVETTAMNLHCSKRQLQRVLKKLVSDGKITKVKKGTYQLL